MHSVGLTFITVLLGLGLTPGWSSGATFTVNSTADSHDANPGDSVAGDSICPDSLCVSLRAAVEEANSLPGPDTIIIPAEVSPINLHLGTICIEDNQTVILGQQGKPIIDGVHNPLHNSTFSLVSDSNSVRGLKIRRSRGDGIVLQGAHNEVGGVTPEERNIFLNNGFDFPSAAAVALRGAAAIGNTVSGNWIGLHGNGTLVDGNRNGVRIELAASGNVVGGASAGSRNLISGNDVHGVIITTRAHENRLTGNFIGPDVGGDVGPGNSGSGVLITDGAYGNVIGGDSAGEGNLISANLTNGITLSGPSVQSNVVKGNVIGADIMGRLFLGNEGHGVELTNGAHHNQIGDTGPEARNLISGNKMSGVHITGHATNGNTVIGNFIGINARGWTPLGNGRIDGDGILIDSGAQSNHIGGYSESSRNTISGNIRFGVHIDGDGTKYNFVTGNFIGVSALGMSSVYNSAGVVISGGAQFNVVGGSGHGEGNVISGNRAELFPHGCGILISNSGTDRNRVCGNIIGLDVNGNRALRNGSAGVIIGDGAQRNVIGGDLTSERNIISGNGSGTVVPAVAAGIHLYGTETRHNRIVGNLIGLTAAGLGSIGNAGHGVGLFAGASENRIGGDRANLGNVITASQMHGVCLSGPDTRANLIRFNAIYRNDSLGIALRNSAQDGINPPVITGGVSIPGRTYVEGTGALFGATVDVYVATPDPSGAGEGSLMLGSTIADVNGRWWLMIFSQHSVVTAVVTNSNNSTSQFAINWPDTFVTSVEEKPNSLPLSFSLEQNYPNPFNPQTRIQYILPHESEIDLSIYNALGQRIATLAAGVHRAGSFEITWDGTNDRGQPVATGAYFYRIIADGFTSSRKMLLVR